MTCIHSEVVCINHFEMIRKYRCRLCGEVMMCACDEHFGRKFLPHQLEEGRELKTQARVPVTIGFQPEICRECRGLSLEAHPKGETHGNTSKVKRYYWREICRRELELFAAWAETVGLDPLLATGDEAERARQEARRAALEEIKEFHRTTPKYMFEVNDSQNEIVTRYGVELVSLSAAYFPGEASTKAQVEHNGSPLTVEDFACRHFQNEGCETLLLESRPIHVLFGVFMWLLIQDPSDNKVRIVMFGERSPKSAAEQELVYCHLPEDFGTPGYGERRKTAIERHITEILQPEDPNWLFSYWLYHSRALREYLWANCENDIEKARKLVRILPKNSLIEILRYLTESYWERYIGWPDLLAHRTGEFFFAEVKSSNDRLSAEQKRWIHDNHERLKLPFKLVKVHKSGIAGSTVVTPSPPTQSQTGIPSEALFQSLD